LSSSSLARSRNRHRARDCRKRSGAEGSHLRLRAARPRRLLEGSTEGDPDEEEDRPKRNPAADRGGTPAARAASLEARAATALEPRRLEAGAVTGVHGR